MPLPSEPDAFETAFRAAATIVLPLAVVERMSRTIVAVKLRLDLDGKRFVDAFFNARSERLDLAVIEGGERLFGYDNLGGWHRHPAGSPDKHEPCAEPDLESFLREAANFIEKQ